MPDAVEWMIGAWIVASYVVFAVLLVWFGWRAMDSERDTGERILSALMAILFAVMLP
jgi:TRAP-type C4-dicarboxylate transport system permease small subunit